MMDWTDDLNSAFRIKSLGLLKTAWHLYGTCNFSLPWFVATARCRTHASA